MPSIDDALMRFEQRLMRAAGEFAEGLARTLAPSPRAFDSAGRPMADVCENLKTLRAEEGRLRRQARRNAPCYDLNRHIAVCRLIAAEDGRSLPGADRQAASA